MSAIWMQLRQRCDIKPSENIHQAGRAAFDKIVVLLFHLFDKMTQKEMMQKRRFKAYATSAEMLHKMPPHSEIVQHLSGSMCSMRFTQVRLDR